MRSLFYCLAPVRSFHSLCISKLKSTRELNGHRATSDLYLQDQCKNNSHHAIVGFGCVRNSKTKQSWWLNPQQKSSVGILIPNEIEQLRNHSRNHPSVYWCPILRRLTRSFCDLCCSWVASNVDRFYRLVPSAKHDDGKPPLLSS